MGTGFEDGYAQWVEVGKRRVSKGKDKTAGQNGTLSGGGGKS